MLDKTDKNDLWEKLVESDKRYDIITAGSPGTDDSQRDPNGLVMDHAYTVISVVQLED